MAKYFAKRTEPVPGFALLHPTPMSQALNRTFALTMRTQPNNQIIDSKWELGRPIRALFLMKKQHAKYCQVLVNVSFAA